jgi:hypothetical protein
MVQIFSKNMLRTLAWGTSFGKIEAKNFGRGTNFNTNEYDEGG